MLDTTSSMGFLMATLALNLTPGPEILYDAFKRRPAFARAQSRLTSGAFIALGLRLAFAKRS